MQAQHNPFFHRGPILEPEYFYDRKAEVSLGLALLGNLQNVAVVGPRRVGKSSLLFHLARPEVHAQHGLAPEAFLFVYVDGEELIELDAGQIRQALLEELAHTLTGSGRDSTGLTLNGGPVDYRYFRQQVRRFTQAGLRIVFCLDEFGCLAANQNLTQSFFSGLRSLASQFSLAFVTASKDEVHSLTYAHEDTLSSPFFNTFATLRLGLLADDEASGLIAHLTTLSGEQLPEEVTRLIVELAGPHPLLLQVAGFHAFARWQLRRGDWGGADDEMVRRGFLAEAEPHYDYYWQQLNPEAQYRLATLPLAGAAAALSVLERQGLIVRRDGQWRYLSLPFEAFLRQKPVVDLLQQGSLVLDLRQRVAMWQRTPLPLTKTEFDALVYFFQHAGRVIPNAEVEEALWPGEYIEDPERVRSLIKGLRKGLGAASGCLETVWGIGFCFNVAC